MQVTDFQTSLCYRKLRGVQLPAVQRPHGIFIVDGVVIAIFTGLDVEVQPLIQFIELFHLCLVFDLFGGHAAILKGGVQLGTFSIGAGIKHLAWSKG